MTVSIAFVSRMSGAAAAPWFAAFAEALPEATVRLFDDIPANERARVDIAIAANPDPVDLSALTGLKWIHSIWAGVERMVADLPGDAPPLSRLIDPELSRTMGEAVLAWAYYLQRDMPAYARQQTQRLWQPQPYRHPGDMTVGILGLGHMGITAAGRLAHAGFNLAGWSQSVKTTGFDTFTDEDGLNTVLERADILVALLPLTPQTRGILNVDALARLPSGASLINFGRGPLVETAALLAALDSGRLKHAVLDVFDTEPLPPDSPLWSHPQVTVLPHISAVTDPVTASRIVAGNIRHYWQSGEMLGRVDRHRGY